LMVSWIHFRPAGGLFISCKATFQTENAYKLGGDTQNACSSPAIMLQ
jgi:hypothetical protein